ncbi:alpha-amylase family glycosyl hydrolase [Haploplasma axanthum]|uniref:Alpha-amylase n=1 Tax=Haploplasma axanthum TaxID=29552 RepID=A0A449BFA7_HAPAX|nr:alpha-amylase family glycosyl hydrolase [Haploplasma axanthum]VEU81134.1 Alpha-amylase precursor [Haploplasma axanthum]
MKKILIFSTMIIMSFLLLGCKKEEKIVYNNDIYYTLFVRSFADSNNDGIGDLKGITENLSYFEDLGVTALWLLPIFESGTYHGYDTIDFFKINSDYGTMDDLKELITEAKKKDIKIVLDLVINHTSDQHPWYLASKSNEGDYRDYYVWQGSTPYQAFGGGLIDLNLRNENVVNEIYKIVDFYMDLGINGFRVDAVKHMFEEFGVTAENENIEFMTELTAYVKNKGGFVVGEVFEYDYNILKKYYLSQGSFFNFYIAKEIKEKIGVGTNNYLLTRNLERMYNEYKKYTRELVDSPFLGNHDLDRIASMIEYQNVDKLKQAVRVLLTLQGSPFIYYGDELGLKGTRYEGEEINGKIVYDEYRRQPFIWGDNRTTTWLASDGSNDSTKSLIDQNSDETSMYNVYKDMISVRKKSKALMDGDLFYSYNGTGYQGYIRAIDTDDYKEAVLVVHNITDKEIVVDIELDALYNSKEVSAYGTAIFKIPFDKLGEYINVSN